MSLMCTNSAPRDQALSAGDRLRASLSRGCDAGSTGRQGLAGTESLRRSRIRGPLGSGDGPRPGPAAGAAGCGTAAACDAGACRDGDAAAPLSCLTGRWPAQPEVAAGRAHRAGTRPPCPAPGRPSGTIGPDARCRSALPRRLPPVQHHRHTRRQHGHRLARCHGRSAVSRRLPQLPAAADGRTRVCRALPDALCRRAASAAMGSSAGCRSSPQPASPKASEWRSRQSCCAWLWPTSCSDRRTHRSQPSISARFLVRFFAPARHP